MDLGYGKFFKLSDVACQKL